MELETCRVAPADWRRVSIESVCSKFTSGGTPSRQRPEFYQNGVLPWIKTKELLDVVLEDAEEWITEKAIASSSAKRLPPNTVLMAMYGATVGQLGVLGREMACNQACAAMVVDADRCDYRFLYYSLLANRRQIVSLATGAAQQNLSGAQIKGWEIPLPEIGEQRQIADVLWALDRRIENLRQINASLEAIASGLFKSRFVDFDDVPQEGMQESELGMIPKGWKVTSLGDHVEAERGLSYKGAGLSDVGEGIPMHNLNSVLEFGGYKYAGIKYYAGDYKDRHLVAPGDIIVANTEQGHQHRLIGFPAIVPGRFTRGLFSHHLYRVRIRAGSPVTREWLYHCLMAGAVRDQIVSCANGSTVNMLKPDGLQIPRFPLPPQELCAEFDSVAGPLRAKAEANVEHTDTLAQLRDALLPRLIAGQLRMNQ